MAVGAKKVRRSARERRKFRIKKAIVGRNSSAERLRLSVFRSSKYTYAQLVEDLKGETLVSVSSKDAEVLAEAASIAKTIDAEKSESTASEAKLPSASSKSVASAFALGKVLAQRALAKKLESVVFDRNGFLYHGRIKAVADGARAGGLKF